ncbi:riboflavin synthase [Akkermansiaceae bacterium]|nr:riboflavin synthase [Akkermansiaceae bacterium]MDB4294287.1 riboflavin synthase [Akkermansiaceae bacterium]MDB4332374.1 riboflavin synthase [Akkermansiaceae bacterium]MDB4667485.1 riboflavin synthase [Akkermansiaceae bacterium]MDB4796221.1 riboflavin synthase [Akkermansiaceae bacterium]
MMFTGLVEATGRIALLEERGEQARLELEIPFSSELSLGESVAVNGCCLTVAELGDRVAFDILAQTLKVTSLGELGEGKLVNLERALAIGDRLGGHFVQGHVDDTGAILDLSPMGQDYRLEVSLPQEIHGICLDKGSLTIDGISLTIAELEKESAVFWITPHTFSATHLSEARIGQTVNLEADLLAKYVKKLTLG